LYEWALSHLSNKIKFLWVSSHDVKESESFLEIRFKTADSIEGIRSAHAIIPCVNEKSVLVKKISVATGGEKHIMTSKENLQNEEVKGFVTVWDKVKDCWHLAYVRGNCGNSCFLVQLLSKEKNSPTPL